MGDESVTEREKFPFEVDNQSWTAEAEQQDDSTWLVLIRDARGDPFRRYKEIAEETLKEAIEGGIEKFKVAEFKKQEG